MYLSEQSQLQILSLQVENVILNFWQRISGSFMKKREVNSYGEAMTASFSVAYKVETMMVLPANSLMVTQETYTGQNIGAGNIDRVKPGVKHTVIMSEII